jgi:hypothetical protein
VQIDRGSGLIRKWTSTHAAAHAGARLEDVLVEGRNGQVDWRQRAALAWLGLAVFPACPSSRHAILRWAQGIAFANGPI